MSNPSGPEQPDEVTDEVTEAGDDEAADGAEPATEVMASSEREHEPATEVMSAEALPNADARRTRAPVHGTLRLRRGGDDKDQHTVGAGDRGHGHSTRTGTETRFTTSYSAAR